MKTSKPRNKRPQATSALSAAPEEQAFAEVVEMIQAARGRALAAVNTALIDLYWQVGEYISRKLETAAWGEGVVEALARYIQRRHPNIHGFTRANLFRMRQFYDTYRGDEKVAPLVRQLPWTHHLIILGQSKRQEEREFYVRLAIRERWGKRELERQLRAAAFDRFEPEHIGKLNFYLEALDRDVRKAHEGPSIGVLLCASKDSEVVEYALSPQPLALAGTRRRVPDPPAGQEAVAGQAA